LFSDKVIRLTKTLLSPTVFTISSLHFSSLFLMVKVPDMPHTSYKKLRIMSFPLMVRSTCLERKI